MIAIFKKRINNRNSKLNLYVYCPEFGAHCKMQLLSSQCASLTTLDHSWRLRVTEKHSNTGVLPEFANGYDINHS